jgi:hypothetical protein
VRGQERKEGGGRENELGREEERREGGRNATWAKTQVFIMTLASTTLTRAHTHTPCVWQGPYARKVFVETLGAPESALLNCVPKEDFGG